MYVCVFLNVCTVTVLNTDKLLLVLWNGMFQLGYSTQFIG